MARPGSIRPGSIEPTRTPWRFPPPSSWPIDDDLVAMGADLEPGCVLSAYRQGLFPMPSGGQDSLRQDPIGWYSPLTRGVLPLDGLKVSRSLRRSVAAYDVRVDTAFAEVIAACGDRGRVGGWISGDVERAYIRLHELGWAHSVETWLDGRLVGGLYGVAIGGLFAGESMFHTARDASKVALVELVRLLGGADGAAAGRLLDVQWSTPHLASLGVVEITRAQYLIRLATARELPPTSWEIT